MIFKDLKKNLARDMEGMPRVRLALLGDSATQWLGQAIRGYAYAEGLAIDLYEADYDQIDCQILDKSSELYAFQADYVLIYQSSEHLLDRYRQLPIHERGSLSGLVLADIQRNWGELAGSLNARIIQFNFNEIDDAVFGNFANHLMDSFPTQLRRLNLALAEAASEQGGVFVCDLQAIQSRYGRERLFNARMYASAKMTLSLEILPQVARQVIRIVQATRGIVRKCLVLDLDNTLWGGIIGEDGLANIQIGELGAGRAFTDFQKWIKALKERGILLAVCSKNDELVAMEPFDAHPDMVLRREDFAVFVANWENKADNIRYIQSVLNIGFDALVFVDDNPFERNLVRQALPLVLVPELPEDSAEYASYLAELNLFETTSVSREDHERTRQYQAEAERKRFEATATSIDTYLAGLEMVATVHPVDKFNVPRVAQLSQRSNQFNLRTVRYTEHELTRVIEDGSCHAVAFSLADRFGDHGLVSAVILRRLPNRTLFIDTWIMSCRVLKRGLEEFVLSELVQLALEQGVERLMGEYLPSPKNAMVRDLYSAMGFKAIDSSRWELEISSPGRVYQGPIAAQRALSPLVPSSPSEF